MNPSCKKKTNWGPKQETEAVLHVLKAGPAWLRRVGTMAVVAGAMLGGSASADEALPEQAQAARLQPSGEFQILGKVTQGGVVVGQAPHGTARLIHDGKDLPLAADGRFVVGLHRDAEGELRLTAVLADGTHKAHALSIEPRTFNIQRVDGLPPKTVQMPPEMQKRRQAEVRQITAARASPSLEMHWAQPFVWPAIGRISGVYGSQRIRNGVPGSPHYGVDIANKTGTPVIAPAAGIIRLAVTDFTLEGGLIIIDHGFNLFSSMLHLSRVDVKPGDTVEQGQEIGAIGATGRATGPHLHWGLRWGNVHVDPTTLPGLPPLPGGGGVGAASSARVN